MRTLFLLALCGSSALAQSDFRHVHGGEPFGIDFLDTTTGFIAEDGGRIRRTLDGGTTWTAMSTPDEVRRQLRVIQFVDGPDPSEKVGYCVGDDGYVLKSLDSGVTWTVVTQLTELGPTGQPTSQLALLHSLHFHDHLEGWVVGDDRAIWHTTDGGFSWNFPNTLPASIHVHGGKDVYDIAFPDPADRDRFTIVLDYGTIATTIDAGATQAGWDETEFDPCLLCPVLNPATCDADNIEIWAVDYFDTQNGVATGGIGTNGGLVFTTDNGGDDWEQQECFEFGCAGAATCGEPQPTLYGMAILSTPANPFEAVSVGYGMTTWSHEILNNPDGTAGCLSCAPGVLGWKKASPPSNGVAPPMNWVDRGDAETAWATGRFGIVKKITNDGHTQDDALDDVWFRVYGGRFRDADTGILVGQNEQLARTTNGGADLALVTLPGPGDAYLRAADSFGTNWITVGTRGRAFWSDTDGATWTQIDPPINAALNGCGFTTDGAFAFVVSEGGHVLAHNVATGQWLDADPFNTLAGTPLRAVTFVAPTVGFAVGVDQSAFLTLNGYEWYPVPVNGVNPFHDLEGVDGDLTRVYAVGEAGVVYQLDLNAPFPFAFEKVFQHPDLLGGCIDGCKETESLLDVAVVPGTSEVYAGGHFGAVAYFDGTSWSTPKSQSGQHLESLDFFSASSGKLTARQAGLIAFD